jgi:hypothetical protein
MVAVTSDTVGFNKAVATPPVRPGGLVCPQPVPYAATTSPSATGLAFVFSDPLGLRIGRNSPGAVGVLCRKTLLVHPALDSTRIAMALLPAISKGTTMFACWPSAKRIGAVVSSTNTLAVFGSTSIQYIVSTSPGDTDPCSWLAAFTIARGNRLAGSSFRR